MNIVFMGTPDFALPTLQQLYESEHRILLVVTQPDRPKGRGRESAAPPVKQFAAKHGLPILQPETTATQEFVQTLSDLQPDLIIVVAFGQILKADLLAVPRHFCMNLHSSLLPRYRGAAPINWAIINGEKETGVTTMKMDTGLDTGDILLAKKVPIADDDDAQSLHDILAVEGAVLVLETLQRLEDGNLPPVPQNSSLSNYAPKLKKEDGLIDWNKSATEIRNRVRGLEPWPGAYTFSGSKRLRICRTETAPGDSTDRPGQIARVSGRGIEVGTGDGRIVVTQLQPEGKKRMAAKSFLAGHKINPGDEWAAQSRSKTTNSN
ncbi:MAG: methionyl-tRNA formyltransferase [Nitrospinae bacterium]|nr:methionyl-tRNA formyltransferase [Nitrospinota bacterium]